MMGGGLVSRDQGFSREAKIRIEVFLSLLPCLPLSSLRRKEKSNYRAPKDLIIGWGSFACVRAAQQEPTWGQPFCAQCEPLCHCTLATFRNIQIECLALLTHPLCPADHCLNFKNWMQLLQFLKQQSFTSKMPDCLLYFISISIWHPAHNFRLAATHRQQPHTYTFPRDCVNWQGVCCHVIWQLRQQRCSTDALESTDRLARTGTNKQDKQDGDRQNTGGGVCTSTFKYVCIRMDQLNVYPTCVWTHSWKNFPSFVQSALRNAAASYTTTFT